MSFCLLLVISPVSMLILVSSTISLVAHSKYFSNCCQFMLFWLPVESSVYSSASVLKTWEVQCSWHYIRWACITSVFFLPSLSSFIVMEVFFEYFWATQSFPIIFFSYYIWKSSNWQMHRPLWCMSNWYNLL